MDLAIRVDTWRLTVDDYHRMGDIGILPPGARVELIEGEIVKMSPIGDVHTLHVRRLIEFLTETYRGLVTFDFQDPVRLNDTTEPQPDAMLLKRRDDFYAPGLPRPSDVFLLIEVSDSSSAYDRNVKVPLYARAGILEVWLLDVQTKVLTAYREPSPTGYQVALEFRRGDLISPVAFPDRPIALADLIG